MSTMSAFKASVGGYVGDGHVHSALVDEARACLAGAKEAGRVNDGYVARCGGGIGLVLLHDDPPGSPSLGSWVSEVFTRVAEVGARLRQHGLDGRNPAVEGAELSFLARPSEPVLCFISDAARSGSWNVPLYRAFADPFNTPGLVADPVLGQGFSFAVSNGSSSDTPFALPADSYRLLAAAGHPGACVRVVSCLSNGETAAVASTGCDPVLLVRCGWPFPSVEEVLEAFAQPCWSGPGAGPIVPVSANGDASARSLGRAVGLGFQVGPDRLVGPRDLFGDPAFDEVRRRAVAAAEMLRRQGPLTGSYGLPMPLG